MTRQGGKASVMVTNVRNQGAEGPPIIFLGGSSFVWDQEAQRLIQVRVIAGGADEDTDDSFKDLGFTDAQQKLINRIMAGNKRQLQEVVKALDPRLKAVEKALEDQGKTIKATDDRYTKMTESIDKILAEADDEEEDAEDADDSEEEADDSDEDGADDQDGAEGRGRGKDSRVAYVERRFNSRIKKIQDELNNERKKTADKEQKLREKDRDTMLQTALNALPGGLVEGGHQDALKLLRDKTKWIGDADDGHWVFITKEGAEVEDFNQGVETDLPAYLRKPTTSGGSGSGGGGGTPRAAQMDQKRKELEQATARAEKSGRDEDWVAKKRIEREVKTLEDAAGKR